MRQTITVGNRYYRALTAQPIRIGVPWPKEGIREPSISVYADDGHAIPVGVKALNHWPDGSIQWTLLDFAADFGPDQKSTFTVVIDDTEGPAPAKPAKYTTTKPTVRLGNGLVEMEIASTGPLVRRWAVNDVDVVEAGTFDAVVMADDGKEYRASRGPRSVTIEHANPLRTVVRVDGKHEAEDGAQLLDYWIRFTVFADRREVSITHHFRNREEPVPGITLKAMRLEMKTGVSPEAERYVVQMGRTRRSLHAPVRFRGDCEIFASDTPDTDNYAIAHHEGAGGGVYLRPRDLLNDPTEDWPWFMNPAYNTRLNASDLTISAVTPRLALCCEDHCLVVCPGNMAALHPKSLLIDENRVRYAILPEWAGPMLIRQGAGKTHEFFLSALPAGASDDDILSEALAIEQSPVGPPMPLAISLDPAWIRHCEVFYTQYLLPYDPETNFCTERKMSFRWFRTYGLTEGFAPAPGNGMWNYGDNIEYVGAHGFNVEYPNARAFNNEEMWFHWVLQDYLRTGRWENAERAFQGCQHIIDVDYVDFSIYPYQKWGQCAHISDHNNGPVYPSHMWFTELFMAYALTGEPEFKRVALNICENLLYWIHSPTEFSRVLRHDLREAGQPLINLSWAYEWNPDPRYIEGCMKIFHDIVMDNIRRFGALTNCPLWNEDVLTHVAPYGDYATWDGLFYLWYVTRDEEIRKVFLSEAALRVTEEKMGTHSAWDMTHGGTSRTTDYNIAAEAYYMSGDPSWLERVRRPFALAFRSSVWYLQPQHDIFMFKPAFEHGLVRDEDVSL